MAVTYFVLQFRLRGNDAFWGIGLERRVWSTDLLRLITRFVKMQRKVLLALVSIWIFGWYTNLGNLEQSEQCKTLVSKAIRVKECILFNIIGLYALKLISSLNC